MDSHLLYIVKDYLYHYLPFHISSIANLHLYFYMLHPFSTLALWLSLSGKMNKYL